MDLSNFYEPKFSAGTFPVIVVNGENHTDPKGRSYIEHTFRGKGEQVYTKKFFIENEKVAKYYVDFLLRCGITKDKLKTWTPEQLNGKLCEIVFEYEKFTVADGVDEFGSPNMVEKSALKDKYINQFSGDDLEAKELRFVFQQLDRPF